jgi:hypothetical protein
MSAINLPPGTRVRISNGTLELPAGCYINVGPGSVLQLDSVHISGPGPTTGKHAHGLVVVRGEGASATFTACTISMVRARRKNGCRPHCVLVVGGGSAVLSNCVLDSSADHGLLVINSGSSATASHCRAEFCQGAGFASSEAGHLVVNSSTSSHNKGREFLSCGSGAVMEVGPGCTAQRNRSSGFACVEGGKIVIQQGCSATSNRGAGFTAQGVGSQMKIGKECKAFSNRHHGFHASNGSYIKTGQKAQASCNGGHGFCAWGPCSHMDLGPGCISTLNDGRGLRSGGTGYLHTPPDCVCNGNNRDAKRHAISAVLGLLSAILL